VSPEEHVAVAEMVDKFLCYDGWSVQLDREVLNTGRSRYVVYVFPDQDNAAAWDLEVGSIHEGLQEFRWFLEYCRQRDKEEDDAGS
jgi:hypothetical protein